MMPNYCILKVRPTKQKIKMKSRSLDEQEIPEIFGPPPIVIPIARPYDVDNEYETTMSHALKSYNKHCQDDRGGSIQKGLTAALRRKLAPFGRHNARPTPRTAWSRPPSGQSGDRWHPDAQTDSKQHNDIIDRSHPRKVLNTTNITLRMDSEMTPRALSFMKRNRPSQQWYSYDHLPSAHLQSARSRQSPSPQHQPKKSNEKKKTRPMSASFSNHNGIFTNPNSDKEYFIIHPDWLSESLTIQKLSLTDRKTKTSTWPPRRCKSAPPPKYRNPITWDN